MPSFENFSYRIDWNGHHNVVVIDDANGGHVELILEDFCTLTDKVINGLFERGNPGRPKSAKYLPKLLRTDKVSK